MHSSKIHSGLSSLPMETALEGKCHVGQARSAHLTVRVSLYSRRCYIMLGCCPCGQALAGRQQLSWAAAVRMSPLVLARCPWPAHPGPLTVGGGEEMPLGCWGRCGHQCGCQGHWAAGTPQPGSSSPSPVQCPHWGCLVTPISVRFFLHWSSGNHSHPQSGSVHSQGSNNSVVNCKVVGTLGDSGCHFTWVV